jgi:alpha-tubulin suppressor-like RCC1 family protein
MALRHDGTIWTWGSGNSSRNAPPIKPTGLMQLGTNHDWMIVQCSIWNTLALRSNGTLWAWGPIYSSLPRPSFPSSIIRVPLPMQVCRESNWAALDHTVGFFAAAWTRSGDLWEIPLTAPLDASAVAGGRILASNSAPGRVALALRRNASAENLEFYSIRPDGTLWETAYHWNLYAAQPADTWHRVGERSDWTWLWGGGGAALGLTSDGTLWMWGYDLGQPQSNPAVPSLSPLQTAMRTLFNRSASSSPAPSRPVQDEPRPLMRFVTTDPNAPASGLPRP